MELPSETEKDRVIDRMKQTHYSLEAAIEWCGLHKVERRKGSFWWRYWESVAKRGRERYKAGER